MLETVQNNISDNLRGLFQEDADSLENGSRIVLEKEIADHIKKSRHLFLCNDVIKNIRYWLRARYEGYVLCNSDGSLHDSARFLVRNYLKQQKYASHGDDYFNHSAYGVKIERDLQATILWSSDTLGVDVIIPSPYADMILKTDLILEIVLSWSTRRKIAIQITTNRQQKEHKFQTIRQLYSGNNWASISSHYRADDVCLLFIPDGLHNLQSICEKLVSVWRDFSQKSDRDIKHESTLCEIHIHSIKKWKNHWDIRNIHEQSTISLNELIPRWTHQNDSLAWLALPFSPNDFSFLQSVVSETILAHHPPWKRDERKILSYFDDEAELSYFPWLIKIIQKWSKKWWTLAEKKYKTHALHGRMSPDDYKKIRRLLSENSLEMPRRDQKLQEIVDMLESWFPGIYECIDCAMCFGGNADQKKRLLSYKKVLPEVPVAFIVTDDNSPVNEKKAAQRAEREEKRKALSLAHQERMMVEQENFRKRILKALDVGSEMMKNTEYAKMLREVVRKLKQRFPMQDKMNRKYVERIENAMAAIMIVYRKCLELEQEENGVQKILAYLNDFIHRFWNWEK
jgi:hypothetical protein